MGERIEGITRRIKRLLGKEDIATPKKLTASMVIRPEQVVQPGRPAPRTTQRVRPAELESRRLTTVVLPDGTTHVVFPVKLSTVPVRDPVTRRLSRKQLNDGMRKTTGYYDDGGRLMSETDARW